MIIPNNALVPHEATQFEPGALVHFGKLGVCILEQNSEGGNTWSAYGHAWSRRWSHEECIRLATLDDLTWEQEEAGKRRHDCNSPGCWCGRALVNNDRKTGIR